MRRTDVLSRLPVVIAYNEMEAAAAIGLSVTKFRAMVEDGRMPRPRRADGRNLYDIEEIRDAFKALPRVGDVAALDTDPWGDVLAQS